MLDAIGADRAAIIADYARSEAQLAGPWAERMLARLRQVGITPNDAVAVLLPGCLEYHLALRGGDAAGIVQPLNPLLSDEKLVSLMNAGRVKVLIAWGADEDSGFWSKAMRIRALVPSLTAVLRVPPVHEKNAPDLPEGVFDFTAERERERNDCLVSGRIIAPTDIAAYFHTGGTLSLIHISEPTRPY